MPLDNADIAQINELIAAANTSLATSLETTLGKRAAELIEAATAPLTRQIETIAKNAPKPALEPKPAPEGVPAALATMLEQIIAPIKAKVEAIDAEKAKAEQTAKTAALVEKTLAAKRPNLKPEQRAVIVGRIAAMQPADEAAVLGGLDALAKEMSALGADVKPLLASPENEGGKPPLDDKALRLQSIRDAGRAAVTI